MEKVGKRGEGKLFFKNIAGSQDGEVGGSRRKLLRVILCGRGKSEIEYSCVRSRSISFEIPNPRITKQTGIKSWNF